MAHLHRQDDSRVMEFVLMRLTFSDPPSGESSLEKPIFSPVTEFRTTGVVMNIFLLDPSERLLSAFVWVASSNTIGLYALLDWSKPEYVFIDTGIEYVCQSLRFISSIGASRPYPHAITGSVSELVVYPLRPTYRHPLRRTRSRTPILLPLLPPQLTFRISPQPAVTSTNYRPGAASKKSDEEICVSKDHARSSDYIYHRNHG